MALETHGDLQGFYLPDYGRCSILELLSSAIRSRGGASPHPELPDLPASALAEFPRLVYLVVDGVGEGQVRRHVESGGGKAFFGRFPRTTVSTVFPATTAAAITTLTTGASPAEHGVLGWFLHLPDLGAVSTILLVQSRVGTDLVDDSFALRDYLALPSHIESVPVAKVLISHGDIPWSRFSLAGTRWNERFSAKTLGAMERRIAAFAKRPDRAIAHAYWPTYDSVCHEVGPSAPAAAQHLEEIDLFLARVAASIEGTGTAVLVTADHGLVDVPVAGRIHLREMPDLLGCLSMIPSGDARCLHCFVRPRKEDRFLDLVRRDLSPACVCISGDDLIRSGVFGPGPEHPAFRSRVGDWILLSRDGYGLSATPAGDQAPMKPGHHGGMSAAEMVVPLWRLTP